MSDYVFKAIDHRVYEEEIKELLTALEGCVEIFNDADIAHTQRAICQKLLAKHRGTDGNIHKRI